MSQMINIRRDVKDTFYRYKMPKLLSKIEGKGNGIKTVVSNMVDIAKALNRPPAYVTKFFGSELGSLSICDEKAARYIVNGAHEAEKLQTLLDGFISKFVLCQACDNPETDLSVSRDGTIYRSCKACGARSTVDMIHKLCTFIQKNPPPKPKKIIQSQDAAKDEPMLGSEPAAAEPRDEGMVAPEGIESGFIRTKHGFNEEDDDWAEVQDEERTADAALIAKLGRVKVSPVAARLQRLAEQIAAMEAFGEWIDLQGADVTNDQLATEAADRHIRPDRAIIVIVQCMLKPETIMAVLARLAPLLQQLLAASNVGAKGEKALIGALERVVAIHHPSLLRQTSAILQSAYQLNLLEEDAIINWFEDDAAGRRFVPEAEAVRVRKAAEPFVTWLKSAEEEDDDDEEDEDEDSDEE